jgi:Spy/CpxP family protein refolding chaperone
MTKFVIKLLLILSIPLTAAAEPQPLKVEGKRHGGILGRLSQELGLTDEQKAKAKELYQENKQKTQVKREEIKDSLTLRQKMKLHKLAKSPEVRELKNDIKERIAKEKLK